MEAVYHNSKGKIDFGVWTGPLSLILPPRLILLPLLPPILGGKIVVRIKNTSDSLNINFAA